MEKMIGGESKIRDERKKGGKEGGTWLVRTVGKNRPI